MHLGPLSMAMWSFAIGFPCMRHRKFSALPGKMAAGICENWKDAVSLTIRLFLVVSLLQRSARVVAVSHTR